MKKLAVLLFLLLLPTVSAATPYVVTTDFPTGVVSTCTFVLNSGAAVDVTPLVRADPLKSYCRYDVAASVEGDNIASVRYRNLWGQSPAVPFDYKKVSPPTPSGLSLSAE